MKLLSHLPVLFSLLMTPLAARAQGYVEFSNARFGPQIIFDNTMSQTNFTVELQIGTSPLSLSTVAKTTGTWVGSGVFDAGFVSLSSQYPSGSTEWFSLRVFDGPSYENAATARGQSIQSTFVVSTSPSVPPPPYFGTRPPGTLTASQFRITPIPEPSTYPFCFLAGIAILIQRRFLSRVEFGSERIHDTRP